MTIKVKFDPGHGGDDPGAVGNGLREKDLTLAIALAAEKHLNDNYDGVEVRLTRRGDSTLSLLARTNQAINWGADSLVSIHINSATNATATGYEDFRHTTQGETSPSGRLQSAVHSKVSPFFPRNRGKKQANYHMVREATVRGPGKHSVPSTLTECGFIVNTADATLLKDKGFLERLGVAHAEGVAAFHGLKRKQAPKPVVPQVIKPPSSAVKIGSLITKQDVPAYARPEWGTQTGQVVRKGQNRHVYAIKNGWYQLFSGEWLPSQSGANFDYMSVKKSEPVTVEPKKTLKRVIVDGKQVGAFAANEGVVLVVSDALKGNAKNIRVEEIK
ncbi:sporulation-specific N-acetylmuramoyl-L-alanine amidase [Exiguobacterium phage vB_EauM-23]|nr:sporulation-specific N-acetylmuramoyl-L-alanine amidase [Exiguobacterium phage vB_EauM-23]